MLEERLHKEGKLNDQEIENILTDFEKNNDQLGNVIAADEHEQNGKLMNRIEERK